MQHSQNKNKLNNLSYVASLLLENKHHISVGRARH
jgi:hypothetical protein